MFIQGFQLDKASVKALSLSKSVVNGNLQRRDLKFNRKDGLLPINQVERGKLGSNLIGCPIGPQSCPQFVIPIGQGASNGLGENTTKNAIGFLRLAIGTRVIKACLPMFN